MSETIAAWHFANKTLRDGRPLPKDGVWLKHDGPTVVMCETGLHASRRVIDALQYAPGSTVCRVSCRLVVDEHKNDKLVCWERRIDWRIENADEVLRVFARKVALSVIDLWDAPDIVREYLETGNEAIRDAARAAAWAAARNAAAWDAARAAARNDAARDAARAAAWAAARAAAWAAAAWDAAAWAAARAAARGAARNAAAWAAAMNAKIDEFNTFLEQMLTEHHEKETGDA